MASGWFAATVVVVCVALAVQLLLVITGASVLVEAAEPPSLVTRVVRFMSYFTIQSNILVLLTTWGLVRTADRDGTWWRIARLDAIAGITVTGVVHWFFLRPILHLQGWSAFADKLLHVLVPVMAVLGWALFGPRRRVSWSLLATALVWPVLWLAYTLGYGAVTGWYPYPFLDVGVLGYGSVLITSVAVAVVVLCVLATLIALDSWLSRTRAARHAGQGPAEVSTNSEAKSFQSDTDR